MCRVVVKEAQGHLVVIRVAAGECCVAVVCVRSGGRVVMAVVSVLTAVQLLHSGFRYSSPGDTDSGGLLEQIQ